MFLIEVILTELYPIGYNENMTGCYTLITTEEFQEWMRHESPRSQYQIDGRLAKISLDGYFGNHKSVSHEEKGALKNKI